MSRLSVLSLSVVLVASLIQLSPTVQASDIDKMLNYILHSKGLEPGSKCHKKPGWKYGKWDKGYGWQYGDHEFCEPHSFEDAFLDLFYKVFHIKEKEAKQELKTAKVELKTEKVHAKTEKVHEKLEHKKPEHGHEEHGGHEFIGHGHGGFHGGFEGLGSELHGYAIDGQGFGGLQGFAGHGHAEQKGHDEKEKDKGHQENRGGLFGGGLFGRGRGLFGSTSNHQPVSEHGHNQHQQEHNQHGNGLVGFINTMSALGANLQAGFRNVNPLNGLGGGPLGGLGGGLGDLAGFAPNDDKGDLIIMPDQHAFYPGYAHPSN